MTSLNDLFTRSSEQRREYHDEANADMRAADAEAMRQRNAATGESVSGLTGRQPQQLSDFEGLGFSDLTNEPLPSGRHAVFGVGEDGQRVRLGTIPAPPPPREYSMADPTKKIGGLPSRMFRSSDPEPTAFDKANIAGGEVLPRAADAIEQVGVGILDHG